MKITYTKRGEDPVIYDYKSDDLLMSEVKEIEKACGVPLELVEARVQANWYAERVVLLWVLMARDIARLKLSDLEKTVRKSEIKVEYDTVERAEMREKIRQATHLDDEEKDSLIAGLDADDAAEGVEPEQACPKEPLKAVRQKAG